MLPSTPLLILLRHGQSTWNLENRFTGVVDVDLSERGIAEACEAGKLLRAYPLDRVFTSTLLRAIRTAELALREAGQPSVPIEQAAALNERHYGQLQGLDKDETRARFGEDQVRRWRRSFDARPPGGESLADTCARFLPYWRDRILPSLTGGSRILVVAHGNSLRALTKELEAIPDEAIAELEIPTGVPIVYELGEGGRFGAKRILRSEPTSSG